MGWFYFRKVEYFPDRQDEPKPDFPLILTIENKDGTATQINMLLIGALLFPLVGAGTALLLWALSVNGTITLPPPTIEGILGMLQ